MATFAEWKQGFIDNITGGHGMDTKTNIDQYSTVPAILKRHSDAIERLEADAQISIESINLLAQEMGYFIECYPNAVSGGGAGTQVRMRTIVRLQPIQKSLETAAQQEYKRIKPTDGAIKGGVLTPVDRIDTALEALDKCASHYGRMMSWVGMNKTGLNSDLFKSGDESPSQEAMRRAIGESWDAASCACCQEYLDPVRSSCAHGLKRCPLSFGDVPIAASCCSNLYRRLGLSRTWQAWEVAANAVVLYIRAVRDGLKCSRVPFGT